jgi:hypothetical protein
MMRLALAAAALALTAAAHTAQQPKPRPAAQAVAVHARIISGNLQTARAFVSTAASTYVTEFPAPLVVAVDATPQEGEMRRVRFHCATKGCTLAPAEQPDRDLVHFVKGDSSTKDVDIVDGRASIGIAIEAARPDATYTLTATPLVQPGERAVPASFRLTSR